MARPNASGASASGDAVVASARSGEPERYVAALLAPPPARPHLLALAAFLSELRRASQRVSEAAMGEMRLEWWREALAQKKASGLTGNPIADAIAESARVMRLSQALLEEIIDARARDLASEAVPDEGALDAYLWKSEGIPFLLAAQVLGGKPPLAAAAASARSYGLVRLVANMPRALARGRLPLPPTSLAAFGLEPATLLSGAVEGERLKSLLAELLADVRRHLTAARQHVAKLPRNVRPAFLPLALVQSYLRGVERTGCQLLKRPVDIAPPLRILRMAAAHWLARI